ncbi:MAG: hypothetical protein AB1646_04175 [Thermodesulfobacteriota bacterium]
MKTIVASLMVAALVVGMAWVFTPTSEATQYPSTELVMCQLPGADRVEPKTRLACQNAGGKVVQSGSETERGK